MERSLKAVGSVHHQSSSGPHVDGIWSRRSMAHNHPSSCSGVRNSNSPGAPAHNWDFHPKLLIEDRPILDDQDFTAASWEANLSRPGSIASQASIYDTRKPIRRSNYQSNLYLASPTSPLRRESGRILGELSPNTHLPSDDSSAEELEDERLNRDYDAANVLTRSESTFHSPRTVDLAPNMLHDYATSQEPYQSFGGSPANSSSTPGLAEAITNGPCRRQWQVPLKPRGPKPSRSSKKSRQKEQGDEPARKRRRFEPEERMQTAHVREIHSCLRCRFQRIRCISDPNDPDGECVRCKGSRTKIPFALCYHGIITDASVFRNQDAPNPLFSRRWRTMDLVDISDWRSSEIRSIEVSQIFLNAPYQIEVREFVPVEGDQLEEKWTDVHGVVQHHKIQPYAIADMAKTAHMLRRFVNLHVSTYINGAVGNSDDFIWSTYNAAFRHAIHASTEVERKLLVHALQLWVACRKTSNPEHICGPDKIGSATVKDPASPWYGLVPMPPIMIAQMECIVYTTLLHPLRNCVLKALNKLVLDNKNKYWYTIYLTKFIFLHSCSMITRRNAEFAKQINHEARFTNPSAIRDHQEGAINMLAHFHYINKGRMPFELALTPAGLSEVTKKAELSEEQSKFIENTARLVKDKEPVIRMVIDTEAFEDDYYWIGQMYVKDWSPGPTVLP